MHRTIETISIIIPARNEGKFIGACLDSLIAQRFPREKMQILVVDGASTDDTKSIALSYAAKHPFVKVLDNPDKFTPYSMNIGVKNATGDAVTIAGAHSTYQPDYIEKSIRYLNEYDADNVGGILKTEPAVQTRAARAIVMVLSSFFGVGNALFRTGVSTPTWADTVFGGCFRRELYETIGLYNEKLTRSQDMEFNMRLKKAGGKILLAPDIVSVYHPKTTIAAFFEHNFRDGIWAVLPMRYGAPLFKIRHLLPGLFVLGLVTSLVASFFLPFFIYPFFAGIGIWLAVAIVFSLSSAAKEKDILLAPFVFGALGARHFGYGAGSLVGLMRLITG